VTWIRLSYDKLEIDANKPLKLESIWRGSSGTSNVSVFLLGHLGYSCNGLCTWIGLTALPSGGLRRAAAAASCRGLALLSISSGLPPSSCRAFSSILSVALSSRFWTAVLHVWPRAAAPVAVSLPEPRRTLPACSTSLQGCLCSMSCNDFDVWCVKLTHSWLHLFLSPSPEPEGYFRAAAAAVWRYARSFLFQRNEKVYARVDPVKLQQLPGR
jgi:hypothetical protein